MQTSTTANKQSFFYLFDKYTSRNGTDWYLALTWIFVLELISSLIEYFYLPIAKTYIVDIQEGLFKEALIAIFISFFVWHFIYSIVQMRKNQFFSLVMYVLLGIYFYITKDVTFNLLFHNIINPFEFEFSGFSLYTIVQIFIKVVIIYLIVKMIVSIKNRKKLDN